MTKVDDKKEFRLTKDDIKKIIEETIEEFEAQKETESEKTIVLEDAEIDKSLDLWERKLEQALKREKKYEEYGDKLKEAKQEIKADIMIATKKMKEAEEDTAVITNPLYRYLPWNLGRRIIKTHKRGARNWLGLLITGVGIVLFWRGIWDGSPYFLSIQGSLIVGGVILILMAWLEKRRIFSLFGQE